MNAIINLSRRNFLKTSALTGGGFDSRVHLPGLGAGGGGIAAGSIAFPLNAFVRIGQDDTVTVM